MKMIIIIKLTKSSATYRFVDPFLLQKLLRGMGILMKHVR